MIVNNSCRLSSPLRRDKRFSWRPEKNVLGEDGRPTQLPNVIDAAFPLTRPVWDFNTAEVQGSQGPEAGKSDREGDIRRPRVDRTNVPTVKKEDCRTGTGNLLLTLGQLGYRASAKKAQICQTKVTYLGYELYNGQRWLTAARKETISGIPAPQNHRQLQEFLGTAGFCRLWIPGFEEIAAPLYPLTKQDTPFVWTEQQQQAFDHIKQALLTSPALGLPDITKPFDLFVDEKQGFAKGVLTQRLGPWRRPIAYLSKKLDPMVAGWPPCLKMIAAIAVLIKDATKLTLGQPLTILAPHTVESLIRQPPDRWLSNARLTHYQSLLLDSDRIQFGPIVTLNPATLLPTPREAPLHDCHQILAETHGTRPDLTDQPMKDADLTWYTDGSSYLQDGKRRAGAAITTDSQIVWASALPEGTSAQRAELIALTQALQLAEGKNLNVYTDSRYAFATAHIHGEIYRRRGLLTSDGKEIKNKTEILALLRALFLPKKLSIMHCPGHQKGDTPEARGNRLADATAKQAALGPQLLTKIGANYNSALNRWEYRGKAIVPIKMAQELINHLHQLTHLSANKMRSLMDRANLKNYFPKQNFLLHQAAANCKACAQVNPGKTIIGPGVQVRGHRPGTHWEIDFTEIKPGMYGYKYLLVFLDTFSGWAEAFPTKKETANIVAKKLLEEIFPRYGMPEVLGSDNGSAFVSQVSQSVAKLLGIDWRLHCAYRPQSSGQVERMNRTIKETLTKLLLETGSKDWVLLLPLAFYWARNTPGPHGLTPFEILYGAPPPAVTFFAPDISAHSPSPSIQAHLQALQLVQQEVWKPLAAAYEENLNASLRPHPYKIGDIVWVRRHRATNLEPRWKGPHTVLLTMPTALKVDGIAAWIHASHVKTAHPEEQTGHPQNSEWTVQRSPNPLKIRLIRR
ncbi:protein NYNRIN-like [Meles meles]|uniref:protein NYNRIN-like n=1 Tax=Meles meles TaxID=9662 RepID=UPI001E698F6F|nr:protein NYNRIN-like [Meles meles]